MVKKNLFEDAVASMFGRFGVDAVELEDGTRIKTKKPTAPKSSLKGYGDEVKVGDMVEVWWHGNNGKDKPYHELTGKLLHFDAEAGDALVQGLTRSKYGGTSGPSSFYFRSPDGRVRWRTFKLAQKGVKPWSNGE